ncbi:MAG TPA: hypothetical protein VG318_03140 [Actinomycetota bacterium]|nr:hypothetical protein [Actinomycetota bacterium]
MQEVLRKAATPLVGALLAATLFVAYSVGNTATATHMPADKIAASASTTEVIGAEDTQLLLREHMKVASPTDLILSLTAECAILTSVATLGDGTSEAFGQVAMQITIDGQPVPVQDSTFGTPQGDDTGEVVFCNRLQRQRTAGFDDTGEDDNEIESYLNSRNANAFNWISINPARYDANSDNILEIEVFGTFNTNIVSDPGAAPAQAIAAVGNRTLVVEPVKLSVHEDTSTDGED